MNTTSTHDAAETLQPRRTVEEIRRLDAEGFAFHSVDALYAFVDQADIVPAVMAQWVAGVEYMNEHSDHSNPEHQAPRRIAYLWLLDAMIASPDAVVEALQAVRDRLVEMHEELRPYTADEVEAVA